MAVDMFIKIGDIEGEAKDKTHGKEIDVLAWSWGMTQGGSMHTAASGKSGKVSVQDLSLTKYVDKASANLMLACCNGKRIDKCNLVVRSAGKDPVEYLKITMEDCLIKSISTGGSGGEDKLTENCVINFGKVNVAYQPQGKDGKKDGGEITMGWDVPQNVEA
jgi:type VI secretion system secreted protein Hcp